MNKLDYYHRAFLKGNLNVLQDAVEYCQKNQVSQPDWLMAEIKSMIDAAKAGQKYSGTHPNKRGVAHFHSQHRQDLIDMWRNMHVEMLRSENMPNVYEEASKLLEKTPLCGDADTIRKSCERFQKRFRENPQRFFLPKAYIGKSITEILRGK